MKAFKNQTASLKITLVKNYTPAEYRNKVFFNDSIEGDKCKKLQTNKCLLKCDF